MIAGSERTGVLSRGRADFPQTGGAAEYVNMEVCSEFINNQGEGEWEQIRRGIQKKREREKDKGTEKRARERERAKGGESGRNER